MVVLFYRARAPSHNKATPSGERAAASEDRLHTRLHTCIHTCTHTSTQSHIHTRLHTCIHTCTHTCITAVFTPAFTSAFTPALTPASTPALRSPQVSYLPEKDQLNLTREQMLAHLDICMGAHSVEVQ